MVINKGKAVLLSKRISSENIDPLRLPYDRYILNKSENATLKLSIFCEKILDKA